MLRNKLLFLLFLQIAWQTSFAQVRLLSCLGKEEAQLYKQKKQGSIFKLNQTIINTLVNSPDLKLSPNFTKVICQHKYSASEQTLFYGLIYHQEIFTIHSTNERRQVSYFLSTLPKLLFTYLSQLQAEMPTAHCLEKTIPEVHYYLERFKYLETELPAATLLADKKKLISMMKRLRKKNELYQKCLKFTTK